MMEVMAKTPAEIQKAYRERQKALPKKPKPKPLPIVDPLIATSPRSFAAFLQERESNIMFPENLHWAGIEVYADLTSEIPKLETSAAWEEMGLEVNSLTVATAMVDVLTDAAKEIAGYINTYKLEEIEKQLATASPAKAKQLEALKTRLEKKTSQFLPVID